MNLLRRLAPGVLSRHEIAVGKLRQTFLAAADAEDRLYARVVRRQVGMADGPVLAEAVDSLCP